MKNIFTKENFKDYLYDIKDFIGKIFTDYSLANIVEKGKKTNKEYRKLLEQNTEPIWMPSINSFFIVLLLVLPFAVLSHFDLIYKFFIWVIRYFNNACNTSFLYSFEVLLSKFNNFFYLLNFETSIYFSNLISIHAGIGAVLIGLAFFVAQSLIDKNDPDKGRVLLYKSYFFPLLTAEILIFLIFIWGDVNIFALLVVVILAFFTIYFLGSTINILIKDYEMEKAKKKMFFEILKRNFVKILDNEITKRIGGNKLYKKGEAVEKETNGLIRITPFGAYDNDKYLAITTEKTGVVTDISFKELEKFIDEIKKIAEKHKINTFNFKTPETTQQDTKINKQEAIVYILPRFLEHTLNTSGEIIQIKEDLFNEEDKNVDLERLNKMASRIFTIQELPDIEKEARLEISKIKDRCLKAIKNQETGELGKIVDFYVDLTKEFFEYINLYGGGFSSEQAEKERTSFFERLKPIEWLSRDIREIFEKGMKSDDINIIREVAYLPIRLANEAIEHKDHLIFQEFIYFPQLLYSFAYDRKNTDKKISKFMFDRTWRYLKELSDYHLELKYKKNKDEENFIGFAIYLLKIFQSLIKASFDRRDFENFEIFCSKSSDLFKRLSKHYYDEIKEEQIFNKISKKRQEMFFGIASWILFITESNKTDIEIKKYFDVCSSYVPSEIKALTQIFIDVHDFDVEDFWGWDNWEMERKGEGEVHSIHVLEKLEKFYAIQSLKSLQSKTDEEIEKIELPHSRDLAFLAEGTRDLLKILDNIKNNPNNWEFVLSDDAISKVDKFKKLLEKAKKAQDEEDLQRKRNAMISEDKVKKFKKAVVKNFYESHGIRNVLNYYKLIEDKSSVQYEGKLKKLGINTMFDKAPFFDESIKWHVHFVGDDNGFDFGRSLVNGENIEIIKKIKDKLLVIEKDKFNEVLVDNNISDIFIISLNGATWKFFEEDKKSKNYIPKWQVQTKKKYPDEIAGIYKFEGKEIPVYEIYDGSKSKEILILNKNYLGKIIQYSPINKNESEEYRQDIFYMDVGVFTDDSRYVTEFLENPPDWLKEIGDLEAQKNYLKERVVIKIFERFEFKLAKEIRGYRVIL